jgi:hypothetical protein
MRKFLVTPGQLLSLLLSVTLSHAISGCAIQLVADYDSAAFEEILAVGKKVDKFYGSLLEVKPDNRPYSAFSEQYVVLETDVRSMLLRNQARALNSESTEISRIILKLLTKYKDRHKARNTYTDGNAKLDRNRFTRLFASAASAEEAKRLTTEDKDTENGSK